MMPLTCSVLNKRSRTSRIVLRYSRCISGCPPASRRRPSRGRSRRRPRPRRCSRSAPNLRPYPTGATTACHRRCPSSPARSTRRSSCSRWASSRNDGSPRTRRGSDSSCPVHVVLDERGRAIAGQVVLDVPVVGAVRHGVGPLITDFLGRIVGLIDELVNRSLLEVMGLQKPHVVVLLRPIESPKVAVVQVGASWA